MTLTPSSLADRVDQLAVEALVDAVVRDVEGRELHLRRGDEFAALLDLGQRVVGEGEARPAEKAARRRGRGQSRLQRVAPGYDDFVGRHHGASPFIAWFGGLSNRVLPQAEIDARLISMVLARRMSSTPVAVSIRCGHATGKSPVAAALSGRVGLTGGFRRSIAWDWRRRRFRAFRRGA